jgi:AcrR family transcriptional regulator
LDVKEYLIEEADKLFCQYGFKSVTMDDIAKQVGMSKKTIYQHFKDKNELVNILIKEKLNSQDCAIKDASITAENAVQELFFAIENIQHLLNSVNPKLFYDLQKYHPTAWLYFKNFKEKNLAESIRKNLNRGVEEGFYRSEIEVDILTQMRLDQVNLIFNHHDNYTNNKYNIAQVMISITTHFLYGISNLKGLELIKEYQKKSIYA